MAAIVAALRRMEAAGYRLEADGGTLRVSPAERLNEVQRDWLTRNKPALLAALAALEDPNVKTMMELFDADVVAVYPNDGEHRGGGMDADTSQPPQPVLTKGVAPPQAAMELQRRGLAATSGEFVKPVQQETAP